MRRWLAGCLCLGLLLSVAHAQTGGRAVFSFLTLPQSVRGAALGGYLLAVRDADPLSSIGNPSLLSEKNDKSLSVLFSDYFADAFYGGANYWFSNHLGSFRAGVQAVSYGKFDGYDLYGNESGTFSAGDYALSLGFGRELIPDKLSMGMNVKGIFSYYETYFSAGLAVDVAASYYNDEKDFCMSLAAVNIGAQFVSYADERESLPMDLQMTVSRKLEHLPARFYFVFHHLTRWNLAYDDPNDPYLEYDVVSGKAREKSGVETFVDNALRHFVLGLEIEPAKVLSLQFSYNYGMRKEMRLYGKPAFTGISYGFSLHVKRFDLQFARTHTHLSSVPNYISVSTNLNQLKKH